MEVCGREIQNIFCSFYSVLGEMSRHGGEGKLGEEMSCVVHGTDLEDEIPKLQSFPCLISATHGEWKECWCGETVVHTGGALQPSGSK